MKRKNIALLGSTGSIGTSALDVITRYPERFNVCAIAAAASVDSMLAQIKSFAPSLACLADPAAADELRRRLPPDCRTEVVAGEQGLLRAATMPEADVVLAAIAGSAGLQPTFAALRSGKDVALANKESLVMAGELMMAQARRSGCRIIPVDSEHSAVFQVLNGEDTAHISSIILTASGGPFLNTSLEDLQRVTPAEALRHPRWNMGSKVTIDSASLMNKGLEVIEARWLFGIEPDRIKVVVHPQSIVHSMVAFVDGTVLAQLSQPDMRGPIAYAFSFPGRLESIMQPLDLIALGELSFVAPDTRRFPSLNLAFRALRQGALMPAVMNAANEIAVENFLAGKLPFPAMPVLIEKVMDTFSAECAPLSMERVLEADRWARTRARELLDNGMGIDRG
ncbi:MAG: 1-deoxy-D-xylulose-5-phosphate reductoisomerase [Deltaproteobacteria bacterium]|nr:1-deoxy-D-xylulose-5-phosphate reductoisomerase [Deltaproteobacteria bacterium]